MISHFYPSRISISETVVPQPVIDFSKDLSFIQKTLLEDHPGVCNPSDPVFVNEMNKNFRITEERLLAADILEEKIQSLQEFGRSFRDAHLWVRYDLSKIEPPAALREVRPFGIEEIKQGVYWIHTPTFHPSKDETKKINEIIQSLPLFREHTVIFDLRGNGGGNSSWGEDLLKALFGEGYVLQQLVKSQHNVYAEWRISRGNLDHVKALICIIRDQFGENHPATDWIQRIYHGMENAFLRGENYYCEPPDIDQSTQPSDVTNFFKGRIIAIIDKGCGSACLDFLDLLKAMNAKVTFVGEPTGADSVYMELREVALPSGKGTLGFPIKVYRNRPRGHNAPHLPDVHYRGNLQDTKELQSFVLKDC